MVQDTQTPEAGMCVCGHALNAHEHYRKGTDCALCPAGECVTFTLGAPTTAAPSMGHEVYPPAEAPRS
jgi:hypothetical protein